MGAIQLSEGTDLTTQSPRSAEFALAPITEREKAARLDRFDRRIVEGCKKVRPARGCEDLGSVRRGGDGGCEVRSRNGKDRQPKSGRERARCGRLGRPLRGEVRRPAKEPCLVLGGSKMSFHARRRLFEKRRTTMG